MLTLHITIITHDCWGNTMHRVNTLSVEDVSVTADLLICGLIVTDNKPCPLTHSLLSCACDTEIRDHV